jgi:hypothetical protein
VVIIWYSSPYCSIPYLERGLQHIPSPLSLRNLHPRIKPPPIHPYALEFTPSPSSLLLLLPPILPPPLPPHTNPHLHNPQYRKPHLTPYSLHMPLPPLRLLHHPHRLPLHPHHPRSTHKIPLVHPRIPSVCVFPGAEARGPR